MTNGRNTKAAGYNAAVMPAANAGWRCTQAMTSCNCGWPPAGAMLYSLVHARASWIFCLNVQNRQLLPWGVEFQDGVVMPVVVQYTVTFHDIWQELTDVITVIS